MSFLPPFLRPAENSKSPAEHISEKINETGLLRNTFKFARNRFISKKLEGNVEVSWALGPFSSGLSCDITSASVIEEGSVDDKDIHNKVLGVVDVILGDLEVRAQEFKNTSYADEMSLSGGHTIELPIASISLNVSATVPSLLARKVLSFNVLYYK